MGEASKDFSFRPNVGVCLINQAGLIWMGQTHSIGPELVTPGHEWQMPQGGIEPGESLIETALRELVEETGIRSTVLLEITSEWWSYKFPQDYKRTGHMLESYLGQTQKWVAMRFVGDEQEIDITAHNGLEEPEFSQWRWMNAQEALDRTVSFKRKQYERVFQAFENHLYQGS